MSDIPIEAYDTSLVTKLVEARKTRQLCRKVAAAASEKVLPFSTDLELRERYINFFGGLRLGKLLEDLDLIAGQMAYKHTEGWERGITIVTAAVSYTHLTLPTILLV